ncbi:MAG: ATPase domain-containing protein, partial [Candidatus Bathyarchaeia archaeon]
RRTAVLDLIDALADLGATCLLTSELVAVGMRRKMQFEEYLAHGVIILQTMRVGKAYGRVIQVVKMRETAIDEQPRPYQITERGIEVYPRESVF